MRMSTRFCKSIAGALSALAFLSFAPASGAEPLKATAELYVVAIQIDSRVFAKGATPNSREAKLLEKLATERSKRFYAQVHTRVLASEQANRDNLLKALDWLKTNVRKQDRAVL